MSIYIRNTATRLEHLAPLISAPVLFTRAPKKASPSARSLSSQRRAFDSDGIPYVYQKSRSAQGIWALAWQKQPKAICDDLTEFILICNGNKRKFAYIDHTGAWFHVNYVQDSLSFQRVAPDLWAITLSLTATDLGTAVDYGIPVLNSIIDSDGSPIMDGSGGQLHAGN